MEPAADQYLHDFATADLSAGMPAEVALVDGRWFVLGSDGRWAPAPPAFLAAQRRARRPPPPADARTLPHRSYRSIPC